MNDLPIQPVPPQPSGSVEHTAGAAGIPGGKSFWEILTQSLDEANRMQLEAQTKMNQFATGEVTNQAEVIAAVRQAELAFQLMTEVRNKLMDAYQEVLRMRM